MPLFIPYGNEQIAVAGNAPAPDFLLISATIDATLDTPQSAYQVPTGKIFYPVHVFARVGVTPLTDAVRFSIQLSNTSCYFFDESNMVGTYVPLADLQIPRGFSGREVLRGDGVEAGDHVLVTIDTPDSSPGLSFTLDVFGYLADA